MIALAVRRQAATPADAEAALAALDTQAGIYFGVDAGIAGLHPLQATLLSEPALALDLHGDGAGLRVLNGFGEALLGLPELAAWRDSVRRDAGTSPINIARALLACFEPSPDVLLIGALPFAAHKLAGHGDANDNLGTLYLGQRLLRRDATGAWTTIELELPAGTVAKAIPQPQTAVAPAAIEPGDDHPPGGYAGMVRRALPWLSDKPLVSLTLSQSYRRRVDMPPAQAFKRLREANPAPASFFFNDGRGERLFGASPDLQLVIAAGEVQALPVCGTVARRPGAVGEAESLRELFNEEVDAASLAVCTDALRNDLAPLCEPGSLRLMDRRRPMSLATVVHAVDRLGGRLREGADAWDAIASTAAPVMVTGTPRKEALAAIEALEASPRGWYGGLVVQVASNGDALAGTILRAAAVRGDVAEVRTGGDLMADSAPEREERESRLKTRSVWRAFGLESEAAARPAQEAAGRPVTVSLVDRGDPFGASLRDCLLGLDVVLSPQAAVTVLAGDAQPAAEAGVVAVGDAAYRLLGTAIRIDPEHGRLLACTATENAPWEGAAPFIAARYASYRLERVPPGWVVWAADAAGNPVALAHAGRRTVSLLFRPDSLLSDPQALRMFRDALAFAAGAG